MANVLIPPDRQRTLAQRQQWRYSSAVKDTATQELAQDVVDPDSDQAIIGRVLAGNRDAFRTLISRYSDPLYRHALCMTGSPDVAEDILQMSFINTSL